MPNIQQNHTPGLYIKGYNPYQEAIYSRGGTANSQPIQTRPRPIIVTHQQSQKSQDNMGAFGIDSFKPSQPTQPAKPPSHPMDAYTTNITGRNLSYRMLENNLKIKVPYADLDLIDRTPENPLHLEGLDFNMHLREGQLKVSDVDVTMTVRHLLNQKQDLPVQVQNLRVAFDPHNQIRVEGKAKKFGIGMPFEIKGNFQTTPQGFLQYTLGDVKLFGLKMNGVMKTFGLNLDKVLKLRDQSKGYWTQGNSVYVDVNRITEHPRIKGSLRGAQSHLGQLILTFGDTAAEAKHARKMAKTQMPNYLQLEGGHFYYDGYFVKDGKVRLDDKTPDSPLQLEQDAETAMTFKKGFVGVSEYKFAQMIKGKLGDDSSLKNAYTSLEDNYAKLNGNMWGFIPLGLQLHFDKTDDGMLMFTPKKAKALGFIPLPDKMIRKQVQKMISDGIPYKDGVALPSLGDTNLGHLVQVVHQKDYLILEAREQYNPY